MKKNRCSATGKTMFINKQQADQALISLKSSAIYNNKLFKNNKRVKNKVEQKRSYFCEYCNGYHLTSIKNKKEIDKKTEEKSLLKRKFFMSINVEKWKENSLPFELGKIPLKK